MTPAAKPIAVVSLEKRVTRLEHDHEAHRRDDLGQFADLRKAITDLGDELGRRMDGMVEGLQAQIDQMTLARVRAEGKAEGIAEVTAAAARPAWWQPWARWAIGGLCTVIIAFISVLLSTIWNLEQAKIVALQSRPAATVTVNPPQPAPQIAEAPPQAPEPESGP